MEKTDNTQIILDIAIALSAQKDRRKLFNMILEKSMEITSSDAGTLYIYEDGVLKFSIVKNISRGFDRGSDCEITDWPFVEVDATNCCGYCVINREILNVEDVYKDVRFGYLGPKKYDSLTGYRSCSMLAVPLIDSDDNPMGVLQLINAQNEDGTIRVYTKNEEMVVHALASQTAIVLASMRYQEELNEQMWSFTRAMAEAIDTRTPYNARHTRNVVKYCEMVMDHINELHALGKTDDYFDKNRREQLVMGAFLHDIGKMVTPLRVMNKESRLGGKEKDITLRLNRYKLRAKIAVLEERMTNEEYVDICNKISEALDMIDDTNYVSYQTPTNLEHVNKVLEYSLNDAGFKYDFFKDDEKECLRIVKGTLTGDERKIIENHVVLTKRILEQIHFNSYFKNSIKWASQHHECINGKGYPEGLSGDELALDARIIAVADICDALMATDRPYKKALSKEKTFEILRDMAKQGNIDGRVVEYLYEEINKTKGR